MLPAVLRLIRRAPWLVFLAWIVTPGVAVGAQLTLSWRDNATNEGGYRVERKIANGGSYSEIAALAANSTGYTDTNLAASTTYCYRVRAFNTAGVSAYTNERCATTAQSALNLTVAKSGTGSGTVVSSPSGINCGSDCSQAFPSGAVVTLTATPSAGSRFDGWSGGGCSGTEVCTLSGNATATVTARLSAIGGPLAFTVGTALVTPNPVAPGGTVRVDVAVTANAAAWAILVDLELYDAGGRKVAQSVRTGQSFTAGQARTFSWTIGPVTLAAGMYTVKVGLFSADWGTRYTWANQVGTVSVGSGPPATLGFTVGNAIVTPNPVSAGQAVRIDVPVTASAAATGILVDLELYNAAGTKVAQRVVGGQSFTAGQTRTYPWTISPVNLSAGTYTVKVGIFDGDWSPLYTWDNAAGTLTVR